MVDVKYDAPFNLRNAPRSKREHGSSSRSHRSSSNNGTSDARAYPNHRHTSDSMLPTPAQSRMTSPSPKPSPNISRSHSAASLSRHSQVDESLDMFREPVLNARLVSLRGDKKKTPNRRGRPRAKFGLEPHQRRVDGLMLVNGETALGETSEGTGDVSDPNADVDASGAEDDFADGDANVSTNVEAPTSPLAGKPEFLPLDKQEREEVSHMFPCERIFCVSLALVHVSAVRMLHHATYFTDSFLCVLDQNCF